MSDTMTQDDTPVITEDDILQWLQANPKFLQKNPHVLDVLTPPQEKKGKGVADFQFYMLRRLKADRDEVIETTREIVETTRANMNNLSRVHNATLMLLEAVDFEDFIRTLTLDIAAILDVDIISLIVETEGTVVPHIDMQGVKAVVPGTVNLLVKDKNLILESNIIGFEEVYGGGASLVKSQALVRLNVIPGAPATLVAFGSRNPELFKSGQATDLLAFLGKVIERCFRLWLNAK